MLKNNLNIVTAIVIPEIIKIFIVDISYLYFTKNIY